MSISGTEQFERKLSSPKSSKPKRVPSEKSPVLEAFIKGVKEHHRDRGVHESRQPCVSLDTKYSKAVTKYVPPSYLLSKETKKNISLQREGSHISFMKIAGRRMMAIEAGSVQILRSRPR